MTWKAACQRKTKKIVNVGKSYAFLGVWQGLGFALEWRMEDEMAASRKGCGKREIKADEAVRRRPWHFRAMVWHRRCYYLSGRQAPRGELRAAPKVGNRVQKMDATAAADTGVCPQHGARRAGIAGVRHRPECVGRRGSAGGTALLAALRTGSAGDSVRTTHPRRGPAQGLECLAGANAANYPCRWLSFGGHEVLPISAESRARRATDQEEKLFTYVKRFALFW